MCFTIENDDEVLIVIPVMNTRADLHHGAVTCDLVEHVAVRYIAVSTGVSFYYIVTVEIIAAVLFFKVNGLWNEVLYGERRLDYATGVLLKWLRLLSDRARKNI